MTLHAPSCGPVVEGERQVWLIARDQDGTEIDGIEVLGPNAGTSGTQSGVELGDKELKDMYHAARKFEDTEIVGMAGAVGGYGQVAPRKWTMRLITTATEGLSWESVERRLWQLTTPDRHAGRTGTFWVRFKERDGQAREIQVRRTTTPQPDSDVLAGNRGWEAWSFDVVANDPWWYGNDIVATWVNSSGTGKVDVEVHNPGDQPADITYTFPAANVDTIWTLPDGLGTYPPGHALAGQRIQITLPRITAGEIAQADTRPYRLPFRVLGQPMSFGRMRQTRFTHQLPPYLERAVLPITVTGDATASVEVRIRPRYERPYA